MWYIHSGGGAATQFGKFTVKCEKAFSSGDICDTMHLSVSARCMCVCWLMDAANMSVGYETVM